MTDAPGTHAEPEGRPERLFWTLLAVALGAALVPIWTVDILPLGDYGAHLEQMDIVARYGDPDTAYSEVYALPDTLVHPNSLSLLASWLLGRWLGVELLGKLLLSWYVIGLPIGLLAVCRAFGRSRWLTFFGVPLTFNALLNVGFLNYLIAFPLLLFAIALSRAFGQRGGWRLGASLATVLLVSFFAHVIVYLISLGIAVTLILAFVRGVKGLVRLAAVLPSLPLLASWVHRMVIEPVATDAGRRFAGESGLGMVFRPVIERAADFSQWGIRFFRDRTDNVAEGLLLALWIGLIVAGLVQRRRGPRGASGPKPGTDRLSWMRQHSLELLTLCCLVAYFALPSHMSEVEIITERVVLLVLVLGTAWPRIQPTGRLVPSLLGLLVVAAIAYPLVVRAKFAAFEREYVGGLRAAIADLPDRSALYYAMWWSENPITYMGPSWHIPKHLHAVENGGWTDDSFAARPSSPIQYQPGRTPPVVGPDFVLDPALGQYQSMLLRSFSEPTELLEVETIALRWHEGWWWLFDIIPEAFEEP